MTYIPNLIKKIDDFCSLADSLTRLKRVAQDYRGGYVSPDDPEDEDEEIPGEGDRFGLYQSIVGAANSISNEANDYENEDVANELLLIAELYKKAIEINGGYTQVKNAMNVALSNIDSLIDDGSLDEGVRDIAENIIEEAASDLRTRSKTSISQQMDEPTAIKELKAVQQAFNSQEARQEMEGQKSVYEKGKPGAETGHGIAARVPPETPQKYAREIERLQDSLANDPNLRNETSRAYVSALVNALKGLVAQIPLTIAAKDQLKVTPDDPEVQAKFQAAEAKLSEFRAARRDLTRRLNDFLRDKEIEALKARMSKPGLSGQEIAWWAAKIKLEALRKSQDLKKGRQIKLLKDLINSTGRIDKDGDYDPLNIPDEMKKKLIEGIDREENYQGDRKSKKAYDRELTQQRAKEEGRAVPAERAPQRGGWGEGEHQQKDFSRTTLPGFVTRLGTGINTAVDSARRYIASVKEGGVPELKPSVDKVSAAIRKGDNAAKYQAISDLKADIAKYVAEAKLKNEVMIGYEITIRLLPFFRKIEAALGKIVTFQGSDGTWLLQPDEQRFIQETMDYMIRFADAYNKQYKFKKPRYDSLINGAKGVPGVFPLIIKYLQDEIPFVATEKTAQTKEEKTIYDRQISQQTARNQGRVDVPAREKQRGGWAPGEKKNQYSPHEMNLAGLTELLQEKINSAIGTTKEKLTHDRYGGDPALKPYADAVTTAIRKGDTSAKYEAIRELKKQIAESVTRTTSRGLEKNVRLLPFFRSLKDDLRKISQWEEHGTLSLNDMQKQYVSEWINKAQRLIELSKHSDLYYKQVAALISTIMNKLIDIVG